MKRIVSIIGTRPEIVKLAPVIKEIDKLGHEHILVASGQHYDYNMDRVFYEEMELRDPDYTFGLRERFPARQVSETMANVEDIVKDADLVIVLGDTNTTLGGALAAVKMGVPVAHVEAGLRSYDKKMPEEVNRILVDNMSDLLFAPSAQAVENLRRESIVNGVHMVGNSITDALLYALPNTSKPSSERPYAVVTYHRIENLTQKRMRAVAIALQALSMRPMVSTLRSLSPRMNVLFFMHPRTQRLIDEWGIDLTGVRLYEPVPYLDMLSFVRGAKLVLTDSGGLQEEACFLGVPCVTLRTTTERPETVEIGANVLVGRIETDAILSAVEKQLESNRTWVYPYGDGTTAKRIAEIVDDYLAGSGQ